LTSTNNVSPRCFDVRHKNTFWFHQPEDGHAVRAIKFIAKNEHSSDSIFLADENHGKNASLLLSIESIFA
jgi:hypothetical protein